MPRTKPPHPAEFRQQIVELTRAGESPPNSHASSAELHRPYFRTCLGLCSNRSAREKRFALVNLGCGESRSPN